MRAFYGFPIPEADRARLWSGLDPLRRASRGVAWVGEGQLHITLVFLGEIDDAQATRASALLQDPALVRKPFEVELRGLDRFPPKGKARVLYLRLLAGGAECLSYHGVLAPRAGAIVPAEGRSYTPHVTVGRVRRPGAGIIHSDLGENLGARFTVDRCILYESTLRRDGAVYRELASARFQ